MNTNLDYEALIEEVMLLGKDGGSVPLYFVYDLIKRAYKLGRQETGKDTPLINHK